MVSFFEEREAAIFNGYTWKEWQEFSLLEPEGRWQRASGIAHYRLHYLVEQHENDAVNQESERRMKANRNGS